MAKLKGITIMAKKNVGLLNGAYAGYWGGYVVDVNYRGEQYRLEVDDGIRGSNVPVVIILKDKDVEIIEIKNRF